MKELTLQNLKDMQAHEIFASGTVVNSPDGIYMTNNDIGRELRWVAKRGGIEDWAIYTHWADKSEDWIKRQGDKITNKAYIKMLVPCDDAAFKMYRY